MVLEFMSDSQPLSEEEIEVRKTEGERERGEEKGDFSFFFFGIENRL